MPPSATSRSSASLDGVAIGGRRDGLLGVVGERHEPEPQLVGQLVGERVAGLDGGREPVGLDVGRAHRAGDVGDHHHRRLALRRGDRALRPRERDDQRAERDQQEERRQVPAPARPRGREPGQQRRVAEAGGLGALAPLHDRVGRGRQGQQQQPDQHRRLAEAHAALPDAPHAQLGSPEVARERPEPVTLRRQHEVIGADAPQRGRDLLALLRRRLRELLAHPALVRVDVQLPPGLRVGQPQVADRRQLHLARVADLDGQDAVARAQRAQRRLPVLLAAEVRDDHHQPAVAGQRGGARDRVAERGRARAVLLRLRAQLVQQREQAEAALARAHDARGAAAERDHAEAVAAPRRHVADGQRDALGDVRLAAVRGAERHRGGDVEQQPRGHRALADVHAHVRLAHARGHVPVDVAHVVARAVGPDQRELGAAADLRREVLAGDEALHPPQHGEIQRAQDGRRDRPGAGLARACAPGR